MAEILGLGMTHQPTLAARAVKPGSLGQTLQDPGLPPAYRTPEGWPEFMRHEWADDEGATHAREHRDRIVAELRKVRKVLADFAPDFIVIWGDDQYENFREDVVPAFCVLAYESIECRPWANQKTDNFWGEPADKVFRFRGHREGAKFLVGGLLEECFDVAYAYRPLHRDLGHAFYNSVLYLDWSRMGFDHPIIPFAVNCYGRRLIVHRGHLGSLSAPVKEEDLDPASPSPSRCFDLGAASARVLSRSPWRVALVASSSWSHAFLTQKHYYLYPDHEADHALYDALLRGDYHVWRNRPLAAVEDSGQQELLNWFCLVGAMAELDRRPDEAVFIESSIMNSSKVIATFRP